MGQSNLVGKSRWSHHIEWRQCDCEFMCVSDWCMCVCVCFEARLHYRHGAVDTGLYCEIIAVIIGWLCLLTELRSRPRIRAHTQSNKHISEWKEKIGRSKVPNKQISKQINEQNNKKNYCMRLVPDVKFPSLVNSYPANQMCAHLLWLEIENNIHL